MRKIRRRIVAVALTAAMLCSGVNLPVNVSADDGNAEGQELVADSDTNTLTVINDGKQQPFEILTPDELTEDMGAGWNLGNTMDGHTGFTPNELVWQNVKTTKALIRSVHDMGFNTVRIPVTWGTMINDDDGYSIDEAWISRVQDIVDYCVSQDMYAIINIHHDGAEQTGWLRIATDDQAGLEEKFSRVWQNISMRFRDYDEHLIFESMNEVKGVNMTVAEENAVIMKLNQLFVDTVRATGSNNSERWLMMPGKYNYIDSVCNKKNKFSLPKDTVDDRLIVSIHYYTPPSFCGGTHNTTDSYTKYTLGQLEYNEIELKPMYDTYTSKGIPVVVGEYGCNNKDNPTQREFYFEGINRIFKKYKLVGVCWDMGWFDRSQKPDYSFSIIDREKCQPIEKKVTDGLMRGFGSVQQETDYSTVTKNPEIIPITSLGASTESVSMKINDTVTVETTFEPSNSNDVILWKTDNPEIATVAYGKIHAKGEGTTTVTAFTQNGTTEKKIEVKVDNADASIPCTKINTAMEELNLNVDEYKYIDAWIEPISTDETLYYTTSDEEVATVSTIGKILATGVGEAVITICTTGGLKKEIKVNVTKKEVEKKLNLSINVYYNDSSHSYFSNEIGKETVCVTEEGTYKLTFDCEKDLSDAAIKSGVSSLKNLTAIYIKDYDVSMGNAVKSPLASCQIRYDEIIVDSQKLTITNSDFKSALKASGIFDTNDPINSWDGSAVKEVQASGGVANFKNIDNPKKISIRFTLSQLAFGELGDPVDITPVPTQAPVDDSNNPSDDKPSETDVKKGYVTSIDGLKYKVTKTGSSGEAEFAGLTGKKDVSKLNIADVVKISGKSYKVTSVAKNACKGNKKIKEVTIGSNVSKIGSKAFYNCSKLSSINIKSQKLKSIGNKAVAGIKKDAVIKCVKSKKSAYKKLFTSKTGYKDSMKIKG